jgi:LysM repeat protein
MGSFTNISKLRLFISALLLSAGLCAAETHTAKVLETLDSGGYTYIKVQEGSDSYWIAMMQRTVKKGESIRFEEAGWMQNFHSKTLNRTFDKILFASDPMQANPSNMPVKPDVMSSKYQQKGGVTVAELFANRDLYVGKKIRVRGMVTKTSAQIMKKNWLHLQDGSSFKGADDLVFTSTGELPAEGSIIIAEGILSKDIDFGYGYFYPVIVENATFTGTAKP